MFNNLGEELKSARESLGISSEQIAIKIKIDLKFLHKIESGDFSFLPEIYIKAFIKEYARIVGLDVNLILKKFKLTKEGKSIESIENEIQLQAAQPTSIQKESKKIVVDSPVTQVFDEHDKASSKSNVFIIAAISFVGFLLIVYFSFFYDNSEIIVPERPAEESILESKKRFENETKAENDFVHSDSTNNDSLVVFLKAIDSSWLKVEFDNLTTKEFYLYKNNQLELKTKERFFMLIGNAAGLDIKFNNQKVYFPEKVKSIARIILDRSGVKHIENISTSKLNN